MAFTTINTTDTLEQMRVKLNNLTTNDFGDPSALIAAGLSATSVIGAVLELNNQIVSAAGFEIRDSSSTVQSIGPGEILNFLGDTNILVTVSASDSLNVTLNSNITGISSINVSSGITINNVSVATKPFAVAQAIALG